ncbi:hypothetical protein DSUL_60248 [Desulfovibrionales bacterium]
MDINITYLICVFSAQCMSQSTPKPGYCNKHIGKEKLPIVDTWWQTKKLGVS